MRLLRPSLILLVAGALGLAGCELAAPSSVATEVGTPAPSTATAAVSPAKSASPAGSPAGSPTASARPSVPVASASTGPSPTPASTPAPTGSAGPTVCAGSDANRTFYANAAAAVAWDVYCPVLPKGWFVDTGNFRAASGGTMTIAYKTTSGLRLELKEGFICTGTAAQCGPLDSTLGAAAYGDRQGTLGRLSGNLVLYVSPGSNPSWQATGIGLDEATFRAICAAFLKVPG